MVTTLLVAVVILALAFDYTNGFHDAANSIATIVTTRVLTPFQAVLWAAAFNFAAYFISLYIIGEFKIGNTIAKSVNEQFITLEVIFAGLIAAILWNLATWKLGIPSSSSHTLIGGFMGAAMARAVAGQMEEMYRGYENVEGKGYVSVYQGKAKTGGDDVQMIGTNGK